MKVAIIPARGGSKRIPGKNIKPFSGKPIIGYSIEAAKESNLFDRIIVSTDSQEIADVAQSFGAEIPFIRHADLADDFTSTDAVILDTLQKIMTQENSIEYFCCLYATVPFITADDLIKGFNILYDSGATSSFTVTPFSSPILRALKINENGRLEMIWPEHFKSRSQDFPEALHDAGQFYWARANQYLLEKRLWSRNAVPILMPRERVEDINTFEDWEIAEKKYTMLTK